MYSTIANIACFMCGAMIMYSTIANIACFMCGAMIGVCLLCVMNLATSVVNDAERAQGQDEKQKQEDEH